MIGEKSPTKKKHWTKSFFSHSSASFGSFNTVGNIKKQLGIKILDGFHSKLKIEDNFFADEGKRVRIFSRFFSFGSNGRASATIFFLNLWRGRFFCSLAMYKLLRVLLVKPKELETRGQCNKNSPPLQTNLPFN